MVRKWLPKSWRRFLSTHQPSRKPSRPTRSRLQLEALEDRLVLSTFDVINTADSGIGSLRQAILDANATSGANTIDFHISGSGVQTISLLSALPTITNAVTIDGSTQNGFAGTPLIFLDGSSITTAGANGLTIAAAGSSTVKDLAIGNFSGDGIQLLAGGHSILIGNFIGVDATGTTAAANGFGVVINSASNVVGGDTVAARNIISANTYSDVVLDGSAAISNKVQGNYIGTNKDGTGTFGSGNSHGVLITHGAVGNTIGGTTGPVNIISGHNFGVLIDGSGSTGNVVEGNYIGTDKNGAAKLGNNYGVYIDGSANNVVGGLTTTALNVLSANTYGVVIAGSGATGNAVQGNYIGTDKTGTAGTTALSNTFGVFVSNSAANNTVGGADPKALNVISNNIYGVGIIGGNGNKVQGNYIGTDANGTAALANVYGVYISDSASNLVGGTDPKAGNVISANSGGGVYITGSGSIGNQVQGNLIGTDKNGTGKLGNGAGVIIAAGAQNNAIGGTDPGSRNVISGNTNSGVYITDSGGSGNQVQGNYIGTNASGAANLGNGADGVFIGSAENVVGGTNHNARNVISGNASSGVYITGSGGNQVQGNLIGTYQDDGGLLHALGNTFGVFINDSADNVVGGTDSQSLNVLSANTFGVVIGGSGSTGNAVQGNYIGTNDDGSAGATELSNTFGVLIHDSAAKNTVGGEDPGSLNVISNNIIGVEITGSGVTGNAVQGNYIGTDVNGTAKLSNTYGVVITDGATENTVGGTKDVDRNVISGNTSYGVYIGNTGGSGNTVQGNYIGTDNTGKVGLGNGTGVVITGSSNNAVGGTDTGAGNVISANSGDGMKIFGGSGNQVQGNYIGTDANGTANLGNSNGVFISNSTENAVGGTKPGAGNVISGNASSGVYITGSGGNTVQGNLIGTYKDDNGLHALGNANGVYIYKSADNVVGGTDDGASNVLSANTFGVVIGGSGSTGNAVEGNYIGTNEDGTAGTTELSNTYGVLIHDSAAKNTVGGEDPKALNVISNNIIGVEITGSGVTGNAVQGNYIGTNASGTGALGNGVGVYIYNSADNVVGGTKDVDRNVLSANAYGVIIDGSGASGNAVQANYIGTDKDGTGANNLGNGFGVYINDSARNAVGGTDSKERNVISANTYYGVYITGSGATGNVLQGNYIGTDKNGTANVGNGNGVYIGSSNNQVGGTDPGAGNTIAYSKYDGVLVDGGTGNTIRENSIHHSGGLGIQLINGGNDNQVPPTLSLTATNPGNHLVSLQGTLTATANTTYALDFFANPTANPSGYGEGQQYLGSARVTTDSTGKVTFTQTFVADVTVGWVISATATDTAKGNTSMFAKDATTNSNLFVVTKTDDTGAGTLREAIAAANAASGTSFIDFAINGSGAKTIGLSSALPTITNSVIIDGASQAVSQSASTTTPLIVLDGSSAGANANGLTLAAGNSFVEDLAIDNFKGAGIALYTNGGNVLTGNYIGVASNGTTGAGNTYGVYIVSADNTIGGTTAGTGNLISANTNGVVITSSGATGNVVEGNYIGTDKNGTGALGNGTGVYLIGSSNNTIGGTDAGAGNVISGNTNDGVDIVGGSDNKVQGNYIGTDATGTVGLGNNGDGVNIYNSANNTVGGMDAGAGNVISGNSGDGVHISGSGATGNKVQGNLIGTDKDGSAANPLANTNGVVIESANNMVGGTDSKARNVISGNKEAGVYLTGSGTTGNKVQGNYIGTDKDGTHRLGNKFGVNLDGSASSNTVGGTDDGAGNVISGNSYYGVEITGSGTTGNKVQGNLIGTDYTGTAKLGNGYGVYLGSAGSNTVGGTDDGAGNVISGNAYDGVYIIGGSGYVVQGNYIGTNANGADNLGNGGDGVVIYVSTNNKIGGTEDGAGNVIAYNGNDGVEVDGAFGLATGNAIRGNSIHDNGHLGIELLHGGNKNQVAPQLTLTATNTANGLVSVQGTLTNAAPDTTYYLDFFASPPNHGEGQYYLGSATVTTDSTGTITFIQALHTLVSVTAGDVITATATDPGDNTSQFSGGKTTTSNLFVVTNTGDNNGVNPVAGSGTGTLRQAIVDANGATGTSFIDFFIEGGVLTISPLRALPTITNSVIIDGASQPGFAGTPLIVLDGTNAGASSNGLTIAAGNSTVEDLAIDNFGNNGIMLKTGGGNVLTGNYIGVASDGTTKAGNDFGVYIASGSVDNTIGGTTAVARNVISGNASSGVYITGSNVSGNVVEGNYIGTDAAGVAAQANGFGVYISGSANNTVGGTVSGAGNVVSGNTYGVVISSNGATGNAVQGNYIGTAANGTTALGNTADGVWIGSAKNNTVGGTAPGAGNVISGNTQNGVHFVASRDNVVQGNHIGTNKDGTATNLGNGGDGVLMYTSSNNIVGGTDAGASNVIAYNKHDGVQVDGIYGLGTGNAIRVNSIHDNVNRGIELVNNGNNSNNDNGQPAPALESAVIDGTSITITGTLYTATVYTAYALDFFATPPSGGPNEGQKFLGTVTETTELDGTVTFTVKFNLPVTSGYNITATATDPNGNTSEFSNGVTAS